MASRSLLDTQKGHGTEKNKIKKQTKKVEKSDENAKEMKAGPSPPDFLTKGHLFTCPCVSDRCYYYCPPD
jgi:hypothetical protein